MKEKDCNCKKDVNRLVQTIDDINKTSSKGYTRNRNILNKIVIQLLKYLIYAILILLLIVLSIPILLIIFVITIIFKKQIKLSFKNFYH